MCCRYNAVNFSYEYQQKTPHSSPVRDPATDWLSTAVPAIFNAVSYYIRPRYSDTRLYMYFFHDEKAQQEWNMEDAHKYR